MFNPTARVSSESGPLIFPAESNDPEVNPL